MVPFSYCTDPIYAAGSLKSDCIPCFLSFSTYKGPGTQTERQISVESGGYPQTTTSNDSYVKVGKHQRYLFMHDVGGGRPGDPTWCLHRVTQV